MSNPLEALTERASPFSEEDRIMHTTKMAERTFGVPVAELGRVEMEGDRAVLIINWGGQDRRLRWSRSGRGVIRWSVDDDEEQHVLGTSATAAQRLTAILGK